MEAAYLDYYPVVDSAIERVIPQDESALGTKKQPAEQDPAQINKFSPGPEGFEYLTGLTEQALKELNQHFKREIEDAELDNAGQRAKLAQNERAYEALPDPNSGGDTPMLVLPLIQRDCDQQVAFFVNAMMRPHPIWTLSPTFPAVYKVPVSDPTMGHVALDTTAEEVAAAAQNAIDTIWRDRLKIRKLAEIIFGETVRGRGPAIVKCVYDPRKRTELTTRVSVGAFNTAQIGSPQPVTKNDGDPIRVYAIPNENFLMRAEDENTLSAEWTSERFPLSDRETRKEIQRGGLILEAKIDDVLNSKGEVTTPHTKEMKADVDGRLARTPSNRHDIREVWFTWEVDGELERLYGYFHFTYGEFLWIARNPYNHKRNPYVAFFQSKRPFRFSDKSTAERLVAIQKVISEIIHLALQNAVVANSTPIVANPDSDAFDWIAKNPIDSGSLIPGDPSEVQALDFGRTHRSMMPEVDWLVQFERSIGLSKYETGESIPGRTSPNTVQQIMQAGMQTQIMQLAGYGESFTELLCLWLKTYKQFNPWGEILYIQDPKTKGLLDLAFRLPDEEALDDFRITLTAADDAAQAEAALEQLTVLMNLLDRDAEQVAKIIGPLANVTVPDGLSAVLEQLITRKQDAIKEYVSHFRSDADRFIVSEQMLRSVVMEKQLVKQQMEQQQAAMAAQPPGPPGAGGQPGPGPNAGPAIPNPGAQGPPPPGAPGPG